MGGGAQDSRQYIQQNAKSGGGIDISGTIATMDTKDTVATTLRMPPELHDRIRVAAAKERKSAQQWMREALTTVLSRVEGRSA